MLERVGLNPQSGIYLSQQEVTNTAVLRPILCKETEGMENYWGNQYSRVWISRGIFISDIYSVCEKCDTIYSYASRFQNDITSHCRCGEELVVYGNYHTLGTGYRSC